MTRASLRWSPRNPGEAGFAYLGLLFLLTIMGVVGAAAVQVGAVVHRRAAEEALLSTGAEFSRALESFRRATPAGQPDEPASLQDLLRDPRFPGVVRHLRSLYPDPLTGMQQWGIQRSEDSGRIAGIYSLSEGRPIKVANFDARFQGFTGKQRYREWMFTSALAGAGGTAGGKFVSPLELMETEEGAAHSTTPTHDPVRPVAPDGGAFISPLDLQE